MRIDVIDGTEIVFGPAESCLAVPAFEGDWPLESAMLLEEHELTLQALVDKNVLTGKSESCFYLPAPKAPYKGVLVLGLGKRDEFDAEALRRAAGKACGEFKKNRVEHVYLDLSGHADMQPAPFLEGLVLGQYDFDLYKKEDMGPPPVAVSAATVIAPAGADIEGIREACELAVLLCLGANGARHLANTAPNEMTPSALADFALGVAEQSDCTCTILDKTQMQSLGMNALLGVARGSAEAPKLIVLEMTELDEVVEPLDLLTWIPPGLCRPFEPEGTPRGGVEVPRHHLPHPGIKRLANGRSRGICTSCLRAHQRRILH